MAPDWITNLQRRSRAQPVVAPEFRPTPRRQLVPAPQLPNRAIVQGQAARRRILHLNRAVLETVIDRLHADESLWRQLCMDESVAPLKLGTEYGNLAPAINPYRWAMALSRLSLANQALPVLSSDAEVCDPLRCFGKILRATWETDSLGVVLVTNATGARTRLRLSGIRDSGRTSTDLLGRKIVAIGLLRRKRLLELEVGVLAQMGTPGSAV